MGQAFPPADPGGVSPSRPDSAKTDSSPQDAPYPMQGRNSATDHRFTFHASRFTVPGRGARATPAAFFSNLLISWLWLGPHALSAKGQSGSPGIPPEKVAAYIYAVIKADRTLYTTDIVDRLQAKGVTPASEHWEQENASSSSIRASWQPRTEAGSGID